jgi:hypothetical protein
VQRIARPRASATVTAPVVWWSMIPACRDGCSGSTGALPTEGWRVSLTRGLRHETDLGLLEQTTTSAQDIARPQAGVECRGRWVST